MTRRVVGLMSGLLAGVLGASAGALLALTVTSYWVGGAARVGMLVGPGQGPGLGVGEMLALILGLTLGFASGVTAWSLVARRMGWLTWEEIVRIMGRSGIDGRTRPE